ncbi:MAG: substrate-binding domain-containing protein [Bacteroidia bacterium]|nr:substrate-binding domain-containing protein [Bacteroidia bacterium]MDW8345944.1 substrate-binding domain-containing protein [Bacteroidia bacterium]
MKQHNTITISYLLYVLLSSLFLSLTAFCQDTTYVIKGVDMFQPILRQIADAYNVLNPNFNVDIQGGGVHNAIRCLNNGVIDAAISNKPLTEYDIRHFEMRYGKKPIQIRLAHECLSIFVHHENPVQDLTINQVFKIFTSEITNWKEVGGPDMPISLYSLEDFSDTYLYFKKSFLGDESPVGKVNYLPTWEILASQISRDKTGISFGPMGVGRGLKKLSLRKDEQSPPVSPTPENLINNTYPITRTIYLILREDTVPWFKSFVEWLTLPYSRDIFRQYGFYTEM